MRDYAAHAYTQAFVKHLTLRRNENGAVKIEVFYLIYELFVNEPLMEQDELEMNEIYQFFNFKNSEFKFKIKNFLIFVFADFFLTKKKKSQIFLASNSWEREFLFYPRFTPRSAPFVNDSFFLLRKSSSS